MIHYALLPRPEVTELFGAEGWALYLLAVNGTPDWKLT